MGKEAFVGGLQNTTTRHIHTEQTDHIKGVLGEKKRITKINIGKCLNKNKKNALVIHFERCACVVDASGGWLAGGWRLVAGVP